jgi:hypothetical protein
MSRVEADGSFSCLQDPASSPCRNPHKSTSQSGFKIRFNIILPSTPRSLKWSLQIFRPQLCICCHRSYACHIHRPSHYPFLDRRDNVAKSSRLDASHYALFSVLLLYLRSCTL